MNSKKTKKTGLLKYALIIPMAISVLILSSMQDLIAEVQTPSGQKNITKKLEGNVENVVLKENKEKRTTDKDETGSVGSQEESGKELKISAGEEIPPSFPGGEKGMYEFMINNIQYPMEAQEKGIEGKVTVQFMITEEGEIIHPKVINKVDPLLKAEALRLVNAMPNWIPAQKEGKNIEFLYTLPINFRVHIYDGKGITRRYTSRQKKNKIGMSSDKTNDAPVVNEKNEKVETGEIDSSRDPLIILDGKEITKQEMQKINPYDIENMSVLKDKSAVELYGEKGKNGVIIITKK